MATTTAPAPVKDPARRERVSREFGWNVLVWNDRWVRPEVEHGREADIDVVRSGLSSGEDTLPLTEAQALCWLRAFNHLRAAAGEILGIDADGWEEQTDAATRARPEFGILIALGWIQEELVAALES